MITLAHDSNLLNWVKITHGLMSMGNAVSYPYPLYPLGKDFFPIILPMGKKIAIPLP